MSSHTSFAMPTHTRSTSQIAAVLLIGALTITGCSESVNTPEAGPTSLSQSSSAANASLTVNGAWVKAMDLSNKHAMTAAFMELTNSTEHDLTVTSAQCDCAAMVEIHETVMDESGSTVMQQIPGGLTVKAGETRILEPGKEHIMLMGLTKEVIAGDDVAITLTLSNESSLVVTAAVRDFDGAKEEYSHQETTSSDSAKHTDGAGSEEHSEPERVNSGTEQLNSGAGQVDSGAEGEHDSHSSH